MAIAKDSKKAINLLSGKVKKAAAKLKAMREQLKELKAKAKSAPATKSKMQKKVKKKAVVKGRRKKIKTASRGLSKK